MCAGVGNAAEHVNAQAVPAPSLLLLQLLILGPANKVAKPRM